MCNVYVKLTWLKHLKIFPRNNLFCPRCSYLKKKYIIDNIGL